MVVADEAYEDLVYDGEHFSIASLDGMFERTITCFTFSKSYAMTGWRLGYAVATEPWMTGLKKATLYSSNGVSTPTQWAGLAAMSIDTATLEEMKEQYRSRRDLLLSGLNEIGLPLRSSSRCVLCFPRCEPHQQRQPRSCGGVAEPCARSRLFPESSSAREGEGHLRFSFSTSIETIEAGLDSLRRNL